MKIRTRLTLWYAAILFASTLFVVGLSYKHFLEEHSKRKSVTIGEFFEGAMEDPDDLLAVVVRFGLPAALIGLAGGWFLMRRALNPISDLTAAAEKINEGNLRQQLPRSGNGDEVDRLTEVFNGMTARLDTSFQRIREFTLHASHELKTPLTVMRGEIETALRDEKISGPQRERLLSQIDEIERLTKIVDGLTLLTKADAGQITLNIENVRLDELLRDAFEDAKILAEPRQIKVDLKNGEPITVRGDRHRLRQLLLNLSDNAVKYNQPGGSVLMELERKDGFVEIKITNTGEGIAAEKLPHVFERFYRCDSSHNNTIDGCGLGLSIAQWIVTAHKGEIRLESQPGKMTTVLARLPLKA